MKKNEKKKTNTLIVVLPLLLVIMVLVALLISSISSLNKNNYEGTWINISDYPDYKLTTKIKINKDKTVTYTKKYSNEKTEYTLKGKWEEEDNYINAIFKGIETIEIQLYYTSDERLCTDTIDCSEEESFHKQKLFTKDKEYKIDTDNQEDNNTKKVNKDKTPIPEDRKLVETEDGKKVIYLFRGEGCPYCTSFQEWLDEIEPKYGDKFVVKDYEVWYDEENSQFMKEVAESRNESGDGVPYIIIGDKSWEGFSDDKKDEILEAIK